MSSKNDLTALQDRFIEEIMRNPSDQKGAYERACEAMGRPKPKGARQNASGLMMLPHVKARIAELQDLRATRVGLQTDDVVRELNELRAVDIGQIIQWDEKGTVTRVTPSRELTPMQKRAIRKIKVRQTVSVKLGADEDDPPTTVTETTMEIELVSPKDLLELAGKHTGAWQRDENPIIQNQNIQQNTVYVVAMPDKAKDAEAWSKQLKPPK